MNNITTTQLKLDQLRAQHQRISERRVNLVERYESTRIRLEDVDRALQVLNTAIKANEIALEYYQEMESGTTEQTSAEFKIELDWAINIALETRNKYPQVDIETIALLACAKYVHREDYQAILFRVKMKLMN